MALEVDCRWGHRRPGRINVDVEMYPGFLLYKSVLTDPIHRLVGSKS